MNQESYMHSQIVQCCKGAVGKATVGEVSLNRRAIDTTVQYSNDRLLQEYKEESFGFFKKYYVYHC
jgi:hypothetical protein